jgi:hypothetical protein
MNGSFEISTNRIMKKAIRAAAHATTTPSNEKSTTRSVRQPKSNNLFAF